MKKSLLLFIGCLIMIYSLNAQPSLPEYWSQIAKALPEPYENSTNGEFGSSIDIFENYAVVGEQGYMGYKGCAYVFFFDGSAWQKIARLSPSDAKVEEYFGNKVAIDGNTIVVAAYKDKSKGIDAGAIYVFEKPDSGWKDTTETAKLIKTDINGSDIFGCSVDISGDVIVVGARGYAGYKGGAFVYEKPASGWSDTTKPVASLITTDLVQWDYLGSSVTISGNTIAVGATGDDDKGSNSGSVYIYEKPDGGWKDTTQTAKLTASDGAAADYFGNDLSMSGNTLVVGTSNSGSVYVFEKPASGWVNATQTAILTATDATYSEEFGSSVYISENTIVVGSIGYDDTKYNIGSVYVFVKPASEWVNANQTAKLQSSKQVSDNNLGYAVCYANNMILSSAYLSDEINYNTGSVLVFNKPASGWSDATESANILPGTFLSNTDDRFGSSVTLVDSTIAIVGSSGYLKARGCVYVLQFDGSSWNKILKITTSDAASYDNFGCSVAVSGNTLVIGAEGVASNAGAVYVYEKAGINWSAVTLKAKLRPSVKSAKQYFGRSVTIEDNTIVVGAFGNDSFEGAVYVFEKPASGWVNATENAILTTSDIAVDDYLGYSVDLSNDVIVASALQNEDKGAAYVYVKPSTGWVSGTQTAKLKASDGAANDNFGYRTAISNDVIVVSAYSDDGGKGSVYLFEKPVTGWADNYQSAKLKASDAATGDYFGCALDIDGDKIVVGSEWQDYGIYEACGSVYFFEKPVDTCWIDATEISQLYAADKSNTNTYGYSVAISGNYAIVGANTKEDNGTNSGAVYLVQRNRPINIISNPANMYNVCKDGEVKFSFTVSNAKSYQWLSSVDGKAYYWIPEKYPFSGTKTNTLTFTAQDTLAKRVYRCVISNPLYQYDNFNQKLIFTFDTLSPIFSAGISNKELQADENNEAIIPDYTESITVTDNCGVKSYTQFPSAGTVINANTLVTLTATDELGNITEQSLNITIKPYDPNDPIDTIVDNVSEYNTNGLEIYPNPTNGLIHINSKNTQIQRIEISDLAGKIVYDQDKLISEQTIDISNFSGHVFILKIYTTNKIVIKKILKQ